MVKMRLFVLSCIKNAVFPIILAFIWLTKGQKPNRDAFYDFINKKLTPEILDDRNYQFLRRLKKEGLITLEALYIAQYCQQRSYRLQHPDSVIKKHKKAFGSVLKEETADSGYCSDKIFFI